MSAPANLGRGAGAGGAGQQLSFLPQPEFSPTWPPKSTLADVALSHLLRGGKLTHPQFETMTGSWRLSEPIRALRHDFGWPVDTIEIPAPTTEHPDRIIGEYVMPDWVIREIGGAHGR